MRLTEAQSCELLRAYGVYAKEACDRCGKVLGPVRYTRYGEPGEWCPRLCRDGYAAAERHHAARRGGRPRKYETERERRVAERRQTANRQQSFRQRHRVTENPLASDSFDFGTEHQNQPLAIPIA